MDVSAVPAEEEEDILQPYYDYLTPTDIEATRTIETVHVQNKYLTRENIIHQEHIIFLRNIIRRLENLLILKDGISTSPPPSSSSPKKLSIGSGHSPWLPPSLGEVPRYRINLHYLLALFSLFNQWLSFAIR